jgi:serine/threonine protein kinase
MIVARRYRLERLLGEGGMGAVWAAVHAVTRKKVALKFLKPVIAAKLELRQRFIREARAASAVRHPNVVTIHDVAELDDGTPFMVMDLLVGESVGSLLERRGRLHVTELARILVPAISAIQAAHALGIVHRDLKPDNLFLAEGGIVKVLDFGIAKLTATDGDAAKSGALTKTGSILGTPFYMSPEQIFAERDIDGRSDVWSLGVIFYECLTGERPTHAENLGQIFKIITTGTIAPITTLRPDVPADVRDLVGRMLTRDREKRPGMDEIASLLERYASAPVVVEPAAPQTRDLAHATTPLRWSALGISEEAPAPPRRSRTGGSWLLLPLVLLAGAAVGIAALAAPSRGQAPAAVAAKGALKLSVPSAPVVTAATTTEEPVTFDAGAPRPTASLRGPAPSAPPRVTPPPATTASQARPPPPSGLVENPPF